MNDELYHYGVGAEDGAPGRGSGRYPLGSGKLPHQHPDNILDRVAALKSQGMTSEKDIAYALGMKTGDFRAARTMAREEERSAKRARAVELRDKGLSLKAIAEEMGYGNDSSVRALLDEDVARRKSLARVTADMLKKEIAEHGMTDVGAGVERQLGVSKEKLKEALYMLKQEGYEVYGGGVQQATNPNQQTILKVVCPPGTPHKDIYDYENIHTIGVTSQDGGETFDPKFVYPRSMDSKRLKVRYAEDGGIEKDGLIELRRGVDDISLGGSTYAQVRILVDGTHYIKGMAVYGEDTDFPKGVDVIFNTNKPKGTPVIDGKKGVLKPIKDDPDNPFGSLIKEGIVDPDDPTSKGGGQRYYYDKDGKKQLSLINKRAEEGDWGEWAHSLPSQFLSKQNESLIKKQLNLAKADKEAEYAEICFVTNPTVKRKLLQSFSDDCDAAAVHLKAAALPRQRYQVIVPIPSLKDNEIYAPNYEDGEQVALIRYPHGGTFEIPLLRVNNNHTAARKVLGNTPADAVGINKKVADRLSGADFDGDTVMVIPTRGAKITSTPALKGLEGFDPKMSYGGKPDGTYKKMSKQQTQTEMGKVSNLICDMTLKGASTDELARAVRHSMVVIDAEKHGLDYKQSEKDNKIAELKRKYQGRWEKDPSGGSSEKTSPLPIGEETSPRKNTPPGYTYKEGASTLISRAKSEQSVLKRKGAPRIDKETGEKYYQEVTETYIDKKGKTHTRMQASTQMAEVKDAYSLSSGTVPENLYADYANHMKGLANRARKELISTGTLKHIASATTVYRKEVDKLNADLRLAMLNAPKERRAQMLAKSEVKAKEDANPDMTKAEKRKARQQALTRARAKVGAQRHVVDITEKEWEAIQAGAISDNQLKQILDHTDIDKVRQFATPRQTATLSSAKQAKVRAMKESGYTTEEISKAVGVSTSTVSKFLRA